MRLFTIFLTTVFFWISFIGLSVANILPVDQKKAVILAYSRINEDNFPQTNLRLSDFMDHLEEIRSGSYNVMALPDLIQAFETGTDLPEKTIAVTFEGGYKSAYEFAIPLLLKDDIPFTVFYASDNAALDNGEYMSWDDLKSLKRNKNVSFGILPSSYLRVTENTAEENKRFLNKASIEFRQAFGDEAVFISYPFGQYDLDYKNMIQSHGINYAFGLQSSVAYAGMDFLNIPRFTMTDGFGDIQRFRMITHALPIPAIDIEPEKHMLDTNTPLFGFSIPQDAISIFDNITCFISGHGKADTFKAGQNRIEIRPKQPLDEGRIRINCTANSGNSEEPKWRWLGMLYTIQTQQSNN